MDDLISIHAAREGGDYSQIGQLLYFVGFQSTPPVKAATLRSMTSGQYWKFQSTPPVKAATVYGELYYPDTEISIHAAREGGDCRIR